MNGKAHSSESVLGDGSIISIEWAVRVLLGVPHAQLDIVSNTTVVSTVSTVVTLATECLLSTKQLGYISISFKEKIDNFGDSKQLSCNGISNVLLTHWYVV